MAVATKLDSLTEVIDSEREDAETSLYTYEILTYPTDYTLEVLVDKWKKGLIGVPEEQRQFIWTQAQSSKLIESFLMGLPVPPVYFYQRLEDNKLQVVDGLQRLLSIVFFFSGFFGDPAKYQDGYDGQKKSSKARTLPVFSLIGLHKDSPFKDHTFASLRENDDLYYNKLVNSVLRSFVMKQLQPKDHTSIFQVFERLNSGGMVLQGQEIRNCIYTGPFNKLLKQLNLFPAWRQVLGTRAIDKRMRDVELILRFFALVMDLKKYKKPMKEWLNSFMESNRALDSASQERFAQLFHRTASAVIAYLGPKPFHIKRGINVAVYDAVFIAFARNIDRLVSQHGSMPEISNDQQFEMRSRYSILLEDENFDTWVSSATTDDQVVKDRAKKAEDILFG